MCIRDSCPRSGRSGRSGRSERLGQFWTRLGGVKRHWPKAPETAEQGLKLQKQLHRTMYSRLCA
eukprot:3752969-Alexandrium_andersonii.AAC.1